MTSATLNVAARLRNATAFALLAACVAVGAAGNARAATETVTAPSITVRYDDLNLATDSGSRALYGRIVSAAQQVCVADDIRDLQAVASARVCRQAAIAQAVRDVHSPKVATLFAAQLSRG